MRHLTQFFNHYIFMKGYLKNPQAAKEAFHSGDLVVQYTDDYIQIKDRGKDIIIC